MSRSCDRHKNAMSASSAECDSPRTLRTMSEVTEDRNKTTIMQLSRNPARAARRTTEATEALGTEQARCIYCGLIDPFLVRPRRIPGHHVFGRKRDDLVVPCCLNCHAAAHEALCDAEIPMTSEKEPTKFARMIFRAFAVHFSLLAKACLRFAQRMEK